MRRVVGVSGDSRHAIADSDGYEGGSWRHCSVNLPQASGTTFVIAISCVSNAFTRADASFFVSVTSQRAARHVPGSHPGWRPGAGVAVDPRATPR